MNPTPVSDILKFVKGLNENGDLVIDSQVPSERNYMQIQQTESYSWYNVYTKPVFAYEAFFRIRVTLRVDKYGEKIFKFGIMAVPLKTPSIDLEFNLYVSTSGITIGHETVKMQNHDGNKYETKSYNFFPSEQFNIVLGDIKINEYDKKKYETMNFKLAVPSENTYEKSGIVNGDYKAYINSSPKRNLKGRGSDSTQIFCNLVKKLIRIFTYSSLSSTFVIKNQILN